MEDLVLNAMRHIRITSKKKPNYISILSYIQNPQLAILTCTQSKVHALI